MVAMPSVQAVSSYGCSLSESQWAPKESKGLAQGDVVQHHSTWYWAEDLEAIWRPSRGVFLLELSLLRPTSCRYWREHRTHQVLLLYTTSVFRPLLTMLSNHTPSFSSPTIFHSVLHCSIILSFFTFTLLYFSSAYLASLDINCNNCLIYNLFLKNFEDLCFNA